MDAHLTCVKTPVGIDEPIETISNSWFHSLTHHQALTHLLRRLEPVIRPHLRPGASLWFQGLQPLHPAGCGRGRRGHPVHRANQLRRRHTLRPQGRHRRPWNQISARVRNAGLRKAAFPTRGHLSRFASRKHPVSRRETAPKIPGALFLNPPIAPGWFTRRNRLPEAGGSSSDAVKRTHSIPPDLTLGYWKKSAPPRAGLLMGSPFS